MNRFEELAKSFDAKQSQVLATTLAEIESLGAPADLFDTFVRQLSEAIPAGEDVERILANMQRFLATSRSPQSWLALFERETEALETLVKLFATSQYLSNTLIDDPEAFDLLRLTGGQPVAAEILNDELLSAVSATDDLRSVMRLLRDYRHRETMRIAYGDFVLGHALETVTGQISVVTDAIVNAALWAAERDLASRRAIPTHADCSPVAFAVVALGKLGGQELNYSSDIDLLFVYEEPRNAPQRRSSSTSHSMGNAADEYFQRLGQLLIKLLSESTPQGIAYRVDMRLRPHGDQGPLVVSLRSALNYYDSQGRTWERQVFIKARAIAGDLQLGQSLIEQLQPWVYRRYLMRADITGIAALKRRIEQRAERAGVNDHDVKYGHGGIRDIEYVVQFLQLLNGGEAPSVRTGNTLDALIQLEIAQCLNSEEQAVLAQGYRLLRKIEHALQIMYDRQTHTLPQDPIELRRLALRLEYRDSPDSQAEAVFLQQLREQASLHRKILHHLLHGAFPEEFKASPESDLILDPQPPEEVIRQTLDRYGFRDALAAYRNLQQLSVETIPFLSTRRCRHFLAAIAPKLLSAIATTPSPDATLISLANVSDSLGGKAVLWELFSISPASMDLCMRLCGCSPYLSSILTSNPGMIDELLDSLMLDRIPEHKALADDLDELCRNAVDIAPILHSFKNSMHLRIGVRDILGKETIQQTHSELSDVAEVCMEQIIGHEFHRLVQRLGMPMQGAQPSAPIGSERPAELVVLAVGKLGGQEPNYHSDLDVIFLFDGEGHTRSLVPNRRFEATTNRHFFNQLSQRVVQAVTRIGSTGRLYDLDVRLRPLGKSGELAITIDDLRQYFESGGGQVWERQALCKARPIWGSSEAQTAAMNCVKSVVTSSWKPEFAAEIYAHRLQLQQGAGANNLKRGVGGTMDVEFLVQMLQMAHATALPGILVPNTLEAIARLRQHNLLTDGQASELSTIYQLLRRIESGIRLLNMSARHDLPDDQVELDRLAFLLRGVKSDPFGAATGEPVGSSGAELADACQRTRERCRVLFEKCFAAYLPPAEESSDVAPDES